jgi:hypothetical protein
MILPAAPLHAEERPTRCAGFYWLLRPEPRECLSPIDTDRPHLTDTPHTTPAGHVLLEVGLASFETERGSDAAVPRAFRFLDVLAKVGLLRRVDLQLGYLPLSLVQSAEGYEAEVSDSLYSRVKINLFGGNEGPLSITVEAQA